ncbi:ABC transporter permease [Rhizobium rhizogenes]|uniref:ABC transporter permease n=1 Tax=Rhizobium rhizogenes TaxID=359 RepID=UPI001573F68F|nr:ABC transporter permease subunit [Rhizobium rhizogenes]NTI26953.1 ABC transporter permease subunit [Rhizobium rhizogenes]
MFLKFIGGFDAVISDVFDKAVTVEEAARDLGATPLQAFFLATLPVIMPAVISGFVLAFSISLDSLVLSSFTTEPGTTTLPLRTYSEVKRGIRPEINALSTLIVLVVTIAVAMVSIRTKFRGRDRWETT